jgi:hypothetical protein
MKKLLVLLAMVVLSHQSFGQTYPLKNNDTHLSQAQAEILATRLICPASPTGMRCTAYGSIVTVEVKMNGCFDRFGGHFSHFEIKDHTGILYFGANNIANRLSMVAYCASMPVERLELYLPFEGPIEMLPLSFGN